MPGHRAPDIQFEVPVKSGHHQLRGANPRGADHHHVHQTFGVLLSPVDRRRKMEQNIGDFVVRRHDDIQLSHRRKRVLNGSVQFRIVVNQLVLQRIFQQHPVFGPVGAGADVLDQKFVQTVVAGQIITDPFAHACDQLDAVKLQQHVPARLLFGDRAGLGAHVDRHVGYLRVRQTYSKAFVHAPHNLQGHLILQAVPLNPVRGLGLTVLLIQPETLDGQGDVDHQRLVGDIVQVRGKRLLHVRDNGLDLVQAVLLEPLGVNRPVAVCAVPRQRGEIPDHLGEIFPSAHLVRVDAESFSPLADQIYAVFPAILLDRHHIRVYRGPADKIFVRDVLDGAVAVGPAQVKHDQKHPLLAGQTVGVKILYPHLGQTGQLFLHIPVHLSRLVGYENALPPQFPQQELVQNSNVVPHRAQVDGKHLRHFGHVDISVNRQHFQFVFLSNIHMFLPGYIIYKFPLFIKFNNFH